MKNINEKNLKKILIVSLVLFFIFLVLSIIIKINTDYSDISLKTNSKDIFSINDLVINNLKFGSTEKEIKKEFGKPIEVKKYKKDVFNYKKLKYKKITFTLRENYNDYILVGINTSSKKYKIGRNIRVGKNIKNTMNKFNIKNSNGNYMYGNYTADALTQEEIKKNIYFGLRMNNQVMYVNRDFVTSDKTNIAELNIKYKNGKITNIKWSYDFN